MCPTPIIIGVLGFQKVCARWVMCMLSDEMKAERVRISRELLERFEKEGEDFLKKIITGDETWVHYYDPENKRQSMVSKTRHQFFKGRTSKTSAALAEVYSSAW